MSSKLVDNYTFAELKDFAKEKKIPRRTVMKSQEDLANLMVRHGYGNNEVKVYLEDKYGNGKIGRVSKKRESTYTKKSPVKIVQNKVVNPDSGRLIKVGGDKYKELVRKGTIRDTSIEK